MGIIDSLSAGYRLLARRLDLLVLPVLLDLWIWFMPPLSIGPLLDRFAAFYAQAVDVEGFPAELAEMSSQVSLTLTSLGEGSNLWTLLANTWLMHVPSLMAALGIMAGAAPITVESPAAAVGLFAVLSLAGIFIGVIFLELAAQALPIGNGDKLQSWRHLADQIVRHYGRIVALVLVVGVGLLATYVPLSFGIGIVALLSPVFSSLLVLLLAGATLVLFFYLYFVIPAIVVDDLPLFGAMAQSVRLVRANFLATLGFVFLTSLITVGFALILGPLADAQPFGTAVAVLANGFLGTGLAVALLVFYRTRILRMNEQATTLDVRGS